MPVETRTAQFRLSGTVLQASLEGSVKWNDDTPIITIKARIKRTFEVRQRANTPNKQDDLRWLGVAPAPGSTTPAGKVCCFYGQRHHVSLPVWSVVVVIVAVHGQC